MPLLEKPHQFESLLHADIIVDTLEEIKKAWDNRKLKKLYDRYHIYGLCRMFEITCKHLNLDPHEHKYRDSLEGRIFFRTRMRFFNEVFQAYIVTHHADNPFDFTINYPLGQKEFDRHIHNYYERGIRGNAFDRRTAYGQERYNLLLILIEEAKRGQQARRELSLRYTPAMSA